MKTSELTDKDLGGKALVQKYVRTIPESDAVFCPVRTDTFYSLIRIEERERFWYNRWSFAKLYDCKRMMKNVWYESAF